MFVCLVYVSVCVNVCVCLYIKIILTAGLKWFLKITRYLPFTKSFLQVLKCWDNSYMSKIPTDQKG